IARHSGRPLLEGHPSNVMQKVADEYTLPRADAVLEPTLGSPAGILAGVRATLARATDGQLALVIAAVLFLIGAWPLALVDVPPFQDLPNHLATITILQHPEKYPEFVFNGYFKTNSALFT